MIPYLLLAGSTLASEDLACVGAGLLVARGSIGLFAAVLSCFAGILVGDLGLFALGRYVGRPVLEWPRFRRIAASGSFIKASNWIEKRGAVVILLSRFTPGLRLPAYLSAGISRAPLARLLFWFVLASALWTPLLVGGSAAFGSVFIHRVWIAAPVALLIAMLATRSRATWHRITHWEFWPAWVAYLPVMPYLLFLALRHRSLTIFTAANPGIPGGGLKGESKSRILQHLCSASGFVPAFRVAKGTSSVRSILNWMDRNGLAFPIVLKPDVGERGRGVAIIESKDDAERYLSRAERDIIVQEYVDGDEFGIFYYRYPGEEIGHILSITAKVFPEVAGDGVRTIRELIEADSRAFCMAETYLKELDGDRLLRPGEKTRLVNIGSHCRGTIFLNATHVATEELRKTIDYVARQHPGFYFGRFDVRSESAASLSQGRFQVLELNGVAAEAAHIYDPCVTVLNAYRSLFLQWRIAFEIGAENKRRGFRPSGVGELLRLLCGRSQPRPVRDIDSQVSALFASDRRGSEHPARSRNRDRSETRAA